VPYEYKDRDKVAPVLN